MEHSSEPRQVQLDLNELSSEASSGSSLDSDEDVDACDFECQTIVQAAIWGLLR